MKTDKYHHLISKFLISAALLFGSACSITGGITDGLSKALLNNDDPETVGEALPAFLVIIDGLINNSPDNSNLLRTGSKLYGAYAGSFVDDTERAIRLNTKGRSYAYRALCEESDELCAAAAGSLDALEAELVSSDGDHLEVIHTYGAASAGWVQSNASDWNAIAELPKIQTMMEYVIQHDESFDDGSAHLYLGVLHSLRPAALGGKPELAKTHFERASDISKGKNLMVKVLFAQQYARLVFDQELHDRLLAEVLEANANAEGYTLANTLAKRQAKVLLKSSSDYF